jgi:PAS domain S-box-containing protein
MIMKKRNRLSYPDSPHPGNGHPSDWLSKPYSIVFTAGVLFVLIFGIAIFQGWRQFETARHNALTADKTTANLLADLILEHNKATIGILQSYAHRPLFIDAVKNKDLAGAYRHLSDLKKNAEIDLTFVTDKRGLLWANFPLFPEAIGKDLSNRDWYKGISSRWRPYISTVFKLIVGDKPLAVAICVPIVDEKERPIGILASSQRLGFLVDAIRKVPLSPYTTVNVIDRTGKLLYSNKFPYQESITDYRFFPILDPALKEKKQQIEMNDPQKDQEKSYLTVVPAGDIGWSVIIERSLRDIYRSEFRRFIETGAISSLLFLLITFFLVYLRKATLFRKTEELLHAEIKLRKSEEELQWLFKSMINAFVLFESVFDDDGNFVSCRFVYINDAYERITGVKNKEVTGKTIHEVWPETEPHWIKRYGEVAVTGASQTFELYHDPTKKLYYCNVYRPSDTKDRFCVIFEDITERKRAEETLRRSEENFRHSLDDSPMGVRIVTIEGETMYANRAILDIYGYDSMEDLKTTPVAKRYTPESHAEFLIRREKRQQGVDAPSEYAINIIRKDGEVRHLLVLRREILWDGERQFQVLYNDITERKRAEVALRESEGRLRTIIEASLDAIIAVNVEGRLVLFNGAAQELFQYSEEEALNQPVDILLREEIGEIHQERLVRFLKKGVGQCGHIGRRMEKFFRRKDGSLFEAEVSMSGGRLNGLRLVVLAIHDITERKQAEEALRRSEENFRLSLEGSPLGARIVTVEGETIYANRAILDIYGFDSIEELKTTPVEKRYTPESYAEFRIRREKRRQDVDTPSEYTISIVRKNGEVRYLQVFRKEILWDGKRQFHVIYQDITDRKQAEEKLKENEKKYRDLTELLPQVIFETDMDGNLTFINKIGFEMFNYAFEDRTLKINVFDVIASQDRDLAAKRAVEIMGGKHGSGTEFMAIRKNGTQFPVIIYASPILREGRVVGMRGTLIDITERKKAEEFLQQSEEKYRTIIENMEDGCHEVDIKGNFTFFNESMRKIMGYEREELLGMNNRQYADEENTRKVYQVYNRVYRTGKPVKNFEWQIIRKDGAHRDIEVSTSLIRDTEGHPTGFRGIVRDTTDRMRAEEELRTSRSQLRALAERIQQIREEERVLISREIHDEMGGGLTGLKMDLSWLLHKVCDTEAGKERVALMSKIHASNEMIDRMIQVVRRIATDLRPSVLDDLGLIAALEWQLQEFTSRTGISHEFVTAFDYINLEKDTAVAVFRIFQETLTNVTRHSGATKVTVLLREGEGSLFDGDSLCLEIRDNGRGITEGEILDTKSLGILGMSERALVFGGDLRISGERDYGTMVLLKIPKKRENRHDQSDHR